MKVKQFLLDMLSFNTPQAIVVNLGGILLLLAAIPTRVLSGSPIGCIWKNYVLPFLFGGNCPETGIFAGCECPACGLTRGVSRLLHGDFAGAIEFNVLSFLVLGVMIVLIVQNIIKWKNSTGQG